MNVWTHHINPRSIIVLFSQYHPSDSHCHSSLSNTHSTFFLCCLDHQRLGSLTVQIWVHAVHFRWLLWFTVGGSGWPPCKAAFSIWESFFAMYNILPLTVGMIPVMIAKMSSIRVLDMLCCLYRHHEHETCQINQIRRKSGLSMLQIKGHGPHACLLLATIATYWQCLSDLL